MRRITVDEVNAAYAATGVKPGRGSFHDANGCYCALGVLHLASGDSGCPEEWCDNNFPLHYWDQFAGAFDGKSEPCLCVDNPHYEAQLAGFEDGRAAALAIFGEVSA